MTANLRSWWKKARKLLEILGIIVVCLLVFTLLVVIVLTYVFKVDVAGLRGKTLWDWLQLLIIPAVLAVGGYLFNLTMSRTEQQNTRDNQRETALQAYLDKISELLLEEHLGERLSVSNLKSQDSILKPENESARERAREIARIRTLTVLPRLDCIRKRSVLLFLQEAGLVSSYSEPEGTLEPIIDLWDADLSQADLSRAHLNGVSLSKANLSGADLRCTFLNKAKFHWAVLKGANLSYDNCSEDNRDEIPNLREADFSKAYLNDANLINVDLREANLSNANLSNADLSGANLKGAILNGAILNGAILKDAKYNSKEIQEKERGEIVTLKPTQWPQKFVPTAEMCDLAD